MSVQRNEPAWGHKLKIRFVALITISLCLTSPTQAAQHFVSSLGAVSSLCTFQSNLDYEPALLADFSKPTPEVNSFAAQGLIMGIAGEKGALDEFVIFDQNRLDMTPVNIDMSIEGGAFDFQGKRSELTIGQSPNPTTECDMILAGQTFRFDLKTIDPQFIAFWKSKLESMSGDTVAHAKSLSNYLSEHTQYWMLEN